MIDIITTEEGLASLRQEWEDLERFESVRVFQTYAWCEQTWKHILSKEQDSKLWILRWFQAGRKDTVIFPFYIDQKATLRFLMDCNSDTCDAVYGECGDRHWCYKEVADTILNEPMIRTIQFQKLNGDSELLNQLGVFLPATIVYKDNAYSWVKSEQCDDFIVGQRQMRSKDKADLKAIRRKAEKYTLQVLSAEKGDLFPVDEIKYLRSEMLKLRLRKTCPFSDKAIEFIKKVYTENYVDVILLREGDEVKALNFVLKKQKNYLSWVFLYTDARTSTSMYVKLLTEWAKEQSLVFDFGVGVYSYKIGTFRPEMALTYSLLCGKTPWRHIKCAIAMNLRFAKDYLKFKLKRH